MKSRIMARDIYVTMQSGKKAKKTVCEKQVVFWSKKYADKAKAEREEVVKKAHDLVIDPKSIIKLSPMGLLSMLSSLVRS